jgi:ABC-2 type transport system permease protein
MHALDYMKVLFLALLGAAFIAVEVWFFTSVFTAIKDQQEFSFFFALHLIERLLAMVFLSCLSMLFFSNFVTALSTLYLSSDMELLLVSPLKQRTIFLSKFAETMWNSSVPIVIFTFPILASYGYSFEAPKSFYLLAFLTTFLFIFVPAGFGVSLTMALVTFFRARKVHQIFTFLGLIFAVTLVILLRLLKPERLVNPSETDDLSVLIKSFTLPAWGFIPSTWAMKSTVAALGSDPAAYGWNMGLLALGSILSVGAAVLLAHKIFISGWIKSKETRHSPGKQTGVRMERFLEFILKRLSPQSRALLKKDIIVFLREPSQWSQLFLLGALVVIYLFNIKFLPENPLYITSTITVKNLLSWLNLGLAGFVLSAIALRFVFPSVSLEGKAFWCIGSSPVHYGRFLWIKFVLYGIPLFIFAELLSVLSNLLLGVDRFILYLSLVSIFFITMALTGLGVGLGALYPRFRLKNPARIALSSGGILFMILSFFYIGIVLWLEALPVYHFFLWKAFGHEMPLRQDALYLLGVLLASILATLVPMVLGKRAISRLEI